MFQAIGNGGTFASPMSQDSLTLHHCKHHDKHDPTCRKCIWWTKHGKSQERSVFDKDALYKQIVESYLIQKNQDGTPKYTVEQANQIAQSVVQREIIRHGGVA